MPTPLVALEIQFSGGLIVNLLFYIYLDVSSVLAVEAVRDLFGENRFVNHSRLPLSLLFGKESVDVDFRFRVSLPVSELATGWGIVTLKIQSSLLPTSGLSCSSVSVDLTAISCNGKMQYWSYLRKPEVTMNLPLFGTRGISGEP